MTATIISPQGNRLTICDTEQTAGRGRFALLRAVVRFFWEAGMDRRRAEIKIH